jgi:hypothetical protein
MSLCGMWSGGPRGHPPVWPSGRAWWWHALVGACVDFRVRAEAGKEVYLLFLRAGEAWAEEMVEMSDARAKEGCDFLAGRGA